MRRETNPKATQNLHPACQQHNQRPQPVKSLCLSPGQSRQMLSMPYPLVTLRSPLSAGQSTFYGAYPNPAKLFPSPFHDLHFRILCSPGNLSRFSRQYSTHISDLTDSFAFTAALGPSFYPSRFSLGLVVLVLISS